MTYEVQFQVGTTEYTVRGPDIDGVLRLIQGVQGAEDKSDYERCQAAAVTTLRRMKYEWRGGELWAPPVGPAPDPHAELRKTWAPGQKWQTRHRSATEWIHLGGAPAWHPDQEYRKCE